MTSDIAFDEARRLVVAALAGHYLRKFPNHRFSTGVKGRDLGDAWAVFLELVDESGEREPLLGSPVMVVSKANGSLSARQIPPHFEILDAPLVHAKVT